MVTVSYYDLQNDELPDARGEAYMKLKKLVEEFDIWKMVAQQEELYKGLLNNLKTGNINESA